MDDRTNQIRRAMQVVSQALQGAGVPIVEGSIGAFTMGLIGLGMVQKSVNPSISNEELRDSLREQLDATIESGIIDDLDKSLSNMLDNSASNAVH